MNPTNTPTNRPGSAASNSPSGYPPARSPLGAPLQTTAGARTDSSTPANGVEAVGVEARSPRTPAATRMLAGATTLQIIPVLTDTPTVRAALDISAALLRAGARALVASSGGPLISELQASGAEWVPFPNIHVNRWNLGRAASALNDIIDAECIDLVHAIAPGGAASTLAVRERAERPPSLITSLPEDPAKRAWFDQQHKSLEALTRGDRIIARSAFLAAPIVSEYDIPHDRVVIIPHSIDTATFAPLRPDQIARIRSAWRVRSGERVFIASGEVTPTSGHTMLVDAVRVLVNGGLRGALFVVPSDDQSDPRHVRAVSERAAAQGVDALFRFTSAPADAVSSVGAADVTIVAAIEPPLEPWLVGQAQALGRPVIASAIGELPEHVLAPPRVAPEQRTGWLFRPEDPVTLARAIGAALTLEEGAFRTLSQRARQFAEATFSPQSVAAATLVVYTSALESRPRGS
jgi:glycosyltransferase involved in cell wall biosynthesis